MQISDFPSIEKIRKAIGNLELGGFPRFNEETSVEDYIAVITGKMLSEFGFMLNAKQPIACNNFFNGFYRVRDLDTITNIDLIREHSYPPIENVKMGRCNFPKNPVFYCSDNPGTALLEVARNSKEKSKKYCLSKWELLPSNQTIIFESFLQVPMPKSNYFYQIKNNIANKINEPFKVTFRKGLSKGQKKGLLEYLKFLDSCFIKDEEYSISATLAHRTLYAKHNHKTDILMYPSVQSFKEGINLAIRPNFVDNNLRLSHLYILNINDLNLIENRISVDFSEYGEVENSDIIWRSIIPSDQRYQQMILEDFGEINDSRFA